jgi:hypothetical protein
VEVTDRDKHVSLLHYTTDPGQKKLNVPQSQCYKTFYVCNLCTSQVFVPDEFFKPNFTNTLAYCEKFYNTGVAAGEKYMFLTFM